VTHVVGPTMILDFRSVNPRHWEAARRIPRNPTEIRSPSCDSQGDLLVGSSWYWR
jgi:hypothetical protein